MYNLFKTACTSWLFDKQKRKFQIRSRASFPMTDAVLARNPIFCWPYGLQQEPSCLATLALLSAPTMCCQKKKKKNLILKRKMNKDENLLLFKATYSSLQGTSGSPVKGPSVFWPPVVWDIQKICARSTGIFKLTQVAPGTTYIRLIKIYWPGKWELGYLVKVIHLLSNFEQQVLMSCPFPLLL